MTPLKIKKIHPEALPLFRGYDESVGIDISALIWSDDADRPGTKGLAAGFTIPIRTGWAVCPPPGHSVLVLSRSGMAKHGIFVTNGPGLIDPDYRGEIIVLLHNGSSGSHYIKHGDRIAQLLIIATPIIPWEETDEFPPSTRGTSGFGSTGR